MRGSTARALALITAAVLAPAACDAAVGCTLNDPDRDIMRIFPEADSYVTEFISIEERGGLELAMVIEADLGDTLEPRYESLDVPYAYYTVKSGGELVGHVHGVNQKGMFGGMQLILATDTDGKILDFYYQKLSSPEAKAFRADTFTDQFVGLTLADFLAGPEPPKVESIEDPSEQSADDFAATLRGLRKNLLLLREFMLATSGAESAPEEEKDD